MQTIAEIRRLRLRELRALHGTWAKINRKLELNTRDATLSQIWNRSPDSKTGRPREMGTTLARKIEKAYGLAPGWMDTLGDSPQCAISEAGSCQPTHACEPNQSYFHGSAKRLIPVVGVAQLGDNGHFVELEYPTGHGDGYIDLPSRDPNAYAVRCTGDSMIPRIRNGEFVVVEPNHEVQNGDEVLVKSSDGRVMVKQFLYRRDGRVHLLSVNEAHPPMAIDEVQVNAMHFVSAIVKSARWVTG